MDGVGGIKRAIGKVEECSKTLIHLFLNTIENIMGRYTKLGLLLIFLLFSAIKAKPQSVNYWSADLNSEAALLGGAVVGGGSGITSIYYNPAGISEIEQKNVSFNSSMFSLVTKTFNDALGEEQDMSQLRFEMSPRFLSYLFRSKKIIELTWELAVFNRDSRNVYVRGSYEDDASNYGLSDEFKYSGIYDFWERYNDYYVGLGTAYEINNKFIVGVSMFISMKSYTGVNEQNTAITNQILIAPSSWYSYKMLSLFDVRIVPKLGIKYLVTKEISLGITFNFPSFDVFNYANGTKVLSYSNIVDNDGVAVPDYFKQEAVDYVTGRFKDPFSIAVGVRRQPSGSKNIYSMTVEWFAKINAYKAVDGESGKSVFGEEKYGTEFSSYYMGNRSILNFAFGYKREVRESLELLFGFKSDFFTYQLPGNFDKKHKEANTFVDVGADMMHFSAGANFIFKNKFKINLGGSLSYGRSANNKQFINFVDANWYDYDTGQALQGKHKNEMIYRNIVLGLFLGFSLDF